MGATFSLKVSYDGNDADFTIDPASKVESIKTLAAAFFLPPPPPDESEDLFYNVEIRHQGRALDDAKTIMEESLGSGVVLTLHFSLK